MVLGFQAQQKRASPSTQAPFRFLLVIYLLQTKVNPMLQLGVRVEGTAQEHGQRKEDSEATLAFSHSWSGTLATLSLNQHELTCRLLSVPLSDYLSSRFLPVLASDYLRFPAST